MNNRSRKLKQIGAVCTVSIILLLYIITFVLAIMNNSYTDTFFNASLFATVFIPIMLYLIKWIANVLKSYNPNNVYNNSHNNSSEKTDKPKNSEDT